MFLGKDEIVGELRKGCKVLAGLVRTLCDTRADALTGKQALVASLAHKKSVSRAVALALNRVDKKPPDIVRDYVRKSIQGYIRAMIKERVIPAFEAAMFARATESLLPQVSPEVRYTLVLDLDETLVRTHEASFVCASIDRRRAKDSWRFGRGQSGS